MALANLYLRRSVVYLRKLYRVLSRARDISYLSLTNKTVSGLIVFAAAGPILFQLGSSVVAALQRQDLFHAAISVLVFGAFGWGQTASFYLFGFSMIALAVSLFYKLRVKFHFGTILLVMVGVGFVVMGGNPGSIPGALPGLQAMIHQNALIVTLLIFPLACFFLSRTLKAAGYKGLHVYTIAVGVFSLVFLAIGAEILVQRLSLFGLFERVLLWNGQLWMELVCVHLIVAHFRRRPLTATVEIGMESLR